MKSKIVFGDVLYETEERVATITLNRPERFNAISAERFNAISATMPDDIANAVVHAENDNDVHVIVLTGAGKGFCGGYDLYDYAETPGENPGIQEMPWDPMIDYKFMSGCTQKFMTIWNCHKPVIAKVHGHAVAGGSDIALCADIIIMNEEAKIGYPPSRVWGCPTTAMWVYRLGAEKAKRMLFTGDLVTGKRAEEMGLIYEAVPLGQLDTTVQQLADRIKGVPKNQLMMMKMMVNQAYDNMGLHSTQRIATIFDGITRHSPP